MNKQIKTIEQKWRANIEKVAYVKAFPGRLGEWTSAAGKQIEAVVSIDAGIALTAVVFADHTFMVTSGARDPEPADLLRSILHLRPMLQESHGDAYEKLDSLTVDDKELTRLARMENVLGAIRNNIVQMPELFEQIPQLLRQLENDLDARCEPNQEDR